MKKEEIAKAVMKIDIVKTWYFNRTGEEYTCSNRSAQDLIEELDEAE